MPNPNPLPRTKVTIRRRVPSFFCGEDASTKPAAGPVPAADSQPQAEVRPHEPVVAEVFTSITLDRLEALLDARGIVTRRAQVPEGTYLKFNVGSFKALILPYGNSPDFSSLQFHIGFKAQPDQQAVNRWNQENRFGRAFLDAEGDPNLQYDIDLEGGATEEVILEAQKTFRTLVEDFNESVVEA